MRTNVLYTIEINPIVVNGVIYSRYFLNVTLSYYVAFLMSVDAVNWEKSVAAQISLAAAPEKILFLQIESYDGTSLHIIINERK
jgi:hypothetical protein